MMTPNLGKPKKIPQASRVGLSEFCFCLTEYVASGRNVLLFFNDIKCLNGW